MGEFLPGPQPLSFNRGEVGKFNGLQGDAGVALTLPTHGHNRNVVGEVKAFRRLEEAREEDARREGLPLEEQLALARADAEQRVQEARPSYLSEHQHELGERIRTLAERVRAAHMRGLKVQLLERDQLIDAATADKLRKDAESYIRSNAELMPLPFAV